MEFLLKFGKKEHLEQLKNGIVHFSPIVFAIYRMMFKYHEHIWARKVSKDRLSL